MFPQKMFAVRGPKGAARRAEGDRGWGELIGSTDAVDGLIVRSRWRGNSVCEVRWCDEMLSNSWYGLYNPTPFASSRYVSATLLPVL